MNNKSFGLRLSLRCVLRSLQTWNTLISWHIAPWHLWENCLPSLYPASREKRLGGEALPSFLKPKTSETFKNCPRQNKGLERQKRFAYSLTVSIFLWVLEIWRWRTVCIQFRKPYWLSCWLSSFSRGYFRAAFVACISAFAKEAALTICRNPFLEVFEAAHGRVARYQQRLLGDTWGIEPLQSRFFSSKSYTTIFEYLYTTPKYPNVWLILLL